MPTRPDAEGSDRRATALDVAALLAVVLLSVLPYVARLGFYSDDWAFLASATLSPDRSLLGAIRAEYVGHLKMRPGQAAYVGLLYWAFGEHPLPYHLVNAAVLAAAAVLLYLALRELGQPRAVAVAVAAVWATLPHYSADRFWVAAFQATLSVALYLLALYADLRSLRAPRERFVAWRLLALAALVASVLCYEVAVPLFLLNVALVWWAARRRGEARPWAPGLSSDHLRTRRPATGR